MSLSDEQKAMRLTGIGGSEISAIVGLNPHAGPIDVYATKLEGREVPDNFNMERGRFFEKPTADWYAYRNGARLREVGTIRDPRHSIVICTPDFLAARDGEDEVDLSIKVPGPQTQYQWGESGTDEVPPAYLLQVQWELIPLSALYGITRAVIAAPIHGDLREYPITTEPEVQAMLVEAALRFWRDCIEAKRPPLPDSTEAYSKWLAKRFPESNGTILQATPQALAAASKLKAAREQLEAAEIAEREARNQLVSIIGSADGIEGDGWRISYRQSKGRASTDWDAVCAEAKVPPGLVEKHTKRTPHRVFKPTFKESRNE